MEIKISNYTPYSDFEAVERKGIGHPDSLADLIAEDLSNRYSKYCLEKFGIILNHWFDKVTLSGGVSELGFGFSKQIKPVTIYLFGRVTESLGAERIPYEALFKESCEYVFNSVFGESFPLDQLKLVVDINTAIGADHEKSFYFPGQVAELKNKDNKASNDTVITTGFAPYTTTEKLCISLENFINSPAFKKEFGFTGWDVKVLATRTEGFYRITVCIPFIADKTPSIEFYNDRKREIQRKLEEFIKNSSLLSEKEGFEIHLNTKDFGDKAYLVPYGSALEKGDYGAVGRGNRYAGVISATRGTNVEAVPGKNPKNHSGKLFTILAHNLAWEFHRKTNLPCEITIVTDNGRDLADPVLVHLNVSSEKNQDHLQEECANMLREHLSDMDSLTKRLINADAIGNFKEVPHL